MSFTRAEWYFRRFFSSSPPPFFYIVHYHRSLFSSSFFLFTIIPISVTGPLQRFGKTKKSSLSLSFSLSTVSFLLYYNPRNAIDGSFKSDQIQTRSCYGSRVYVIHVRYHTETICFRKKKNEERNLWDRTSPSAHAVKTVSSLDIIFFFSFPKGQYIFSTIALTSSKVCYLERTYVQPSLAQYSKKVAAASFTYVRRIFSDFLPLSL